MKEEKNISQVIKKGIAKAILWISLILFFISSLIVLAMQSTVVQTQVAEWGSSILSRKTGFQIDIHKVNIDWFDKIRLSDLTIKDQKGKQFINLETITIDYDIEQLVAPERILLDQVVLKSGRINLIRQKNDSYFNVDYFIAAIRDLSKRDSTKKRNVKQFNIDNIQLRDLELGVINLDRDSVVEGFNYNQFILHNLKGDVRNFISARDTIKMKVDSLTALDSASRLHLKNIKTDFEISQRKLSFTNTDLYVNDSYIADSIVFTYDGMKNLNSFIDSVQVNALLDSTFITATDLAYFAPQLKPYKEKITLSGEFRGKVKNFTSRNVAINIGENSFLEGSIQIDGLPEFSESFIDLNLKKAYLEPSDLNQYVSDSLTQATLNNLGLVTFNGSFIGFPTDFVANGIFNSNLGRLESDLNLKIGTTAADTEYKGSLSTFNFDFGKLVGRDTLFQRVQMTGKINGKGITLETADAQLNAQISFIGINGYDYQNINTNARFATEFFNGELTVDDPELKLSVDGSIDLREGKNSINVNTNLDSVNLKKINITKEDVIIKANGTLDGSGIVLDSIVGDAFLQSVYAQYQGNSLYLDTLSIHSERDGDKKSIEVKSDLFDVNLNGNFLLSKLPKDIQLLVKEFKMHVRNESEDLKAYYEASKNKEFNDYNVLFDIRLKKINPLINLFEPELFIKNNTAFFGSFTSGLNSVFTVNAQIDSIHYKNISFKNNEVDVTFSNNHKQENVLAMAYVFSQEQQYNESLTSENIESELVWSGNKIDFSVFAQQKQYNNRIDLAGSLIFKNDSTDVTVNYSNVLALGEEWNFLDENRLTISGNEYFFKNVGLKSGKQDIIFDGVLSKDSAKHLYVAIDNFKIENLNSFTTKREYKGLLDGSVDISRYNKQYLVNSDLTLNDFYVERFYVGNISGSTDWVQSDKQLNLDFLVNREGLNIISINGNYTPAIADNPLNLSAQFVDANLLIAEPFVDNIFTNIEGTISGDFSIRGTPSYPILKGLAQVNNGRTTIDYLKTEYRFEGPVRFNQDIVSLENIRLQDRQNNVAVLSGDLLHNGFTDLYLDLRGDMDNFQVLNTAAADNELYYGTAYTSGFVTFEGPSENLTIDATGVTDKGTRIFIPVETTTTVEKEEYIHFINIEDTVGKKVSVQNVVDQVNLTGISLNLDLEVTTDAYAEIIFDIKAGDIIRGRGNGQLSLNIDNNGEFTMFGDYTLAEGGYNFTLYNIINKEFKIEPGSEIRWDGDPYGGILDIEATYEQNVSLTPIVDTAYAEAPELKRRYPSKVILDLTGDLMKPAVDFDIEFSDYPDQINTENGVYALRTEMAAFESELEANEQELKRQVFSLIILRRLSPRASFAVSGSVGNSVSEFLSNQLSYWITQIDENLEIDVDFGSFDQEQFNTFQLRLSYSFLDGRLRVTRDGGFSQGQNTNVNQEILGVLGDWTVEYLLTKDGKLRAKIYNRTNYNTYNVNTNSTATTSTGVSLVHLTSFNQLREIFQNQKKKKAEKEKDSQQQKNKDSEENTSPKQDDAVMREEDEETE